MCSLCLARVYGCYDNLDGGELAEALEDFTGGIAEPINLEEGKYATDEPKRDELFKVMKAAHKNRALQAAAIPVSHEWKPGSGRKGENT